MRKGFVLGIMILLSGTLSLPALALTSVNPSEIHKHKDWTISMEWIHVTKCYFQDKYSKQRYQFRSRQSLMRIDYTIPKEYITFYAKVGARDLNIIDDGEGAEYSSKYVSVSGGGMRVYPYTHPGKRIVLGLGGEYLTSIAHQLIGKGDGAKMKANWKEWQTYLWCSKGFKWITPYLGARYSKSRIEWTDQNDCEVSLKSQKNYGLFGGFELNFAKGVSLIVEGRCLDEEAYTTGLTIRF